MVNISLISWGSNLSKHTFVSRYCDILHPLSLDNASCLLYFTIILRRRKMKHYISPLIHWAFILSRGNTPETRGTAYVVYEDIFDAKNACDHLSGFNVCNRYLVVLYYNANRVCARLLLFPFCKAASFCLLNFKIWRRCFCSVLCVFTGIPENGHKKERGTVEDLEREIWHQHGSPKVELWKHLFLFFCSVLFTSNVLFFSGVCKYFYILANGHLF